MHTKDNAGSRGNDNTTTRHKGEGRESEQKGAKSVSNKNTGRHRKDESEGSSHNTTKRGENSI